MTEKMHPETTAEGAKITESTLNKKEQHMLESILRTLARAQARDLTRRLEE